MRHVVTVISVALILIFVVLVVGNCLSPFTFDHRSPTISSLSWLFVRGEPLYPGLDAAQRYALPYGPMAFMINGALMWAMGPGPLTAKTGTGLAVMLSIVFCFLAFRTVAGTSRAVTFTSLFVLYVGFFDTRSFWPGPDSFLLLCVCAGLWASTALEGRFPEILCGALVGVAVNLKLHAFLYFVPLLTLLVVRKGMKSLLPASIAGALIAGFPFLFPNVSLTNMAAWFLVYAGHGINLRILANNPLFLAFISAPFVLWSLHYLGVDPRGFRLFLSQRSGLLVSLAASACAVCVVGAKEGAGPYHLIPFIPLFLYACACMNPGDQQTRRRVPLPIALVIVILAMPVGYKLTVKFSNVVRMMVQAMTSDAARAGLVLEDIRSVEHAEKGSIALGYGADEGYRLTFYRYEPVFHGQPYLLDAAALMDMQLAGLGIPETTLMALREGRVRLWLIPRGEAPFTMKNFYGFRPLFGKRFREEFLKYYKLRGSSRFFDLWSYNPR